MAEHKLVVYHCRMRKKQEHVIIKDKVELKRKTEDRFRKIQPKILETSKHK